MQVVSPLSYQRSRLVSLLNYCRSCLVSLLGGLTTVLVTVMICGEESVCSYFFQSGWGW